MIFLLRFLGQLLFGSFFLWSSWIRARGGMIVDEAMNLFLSQLEKKAKLVLPGHHTYFGKLN